MTILDELNKRPSIGLGTWENDDPDQCAETVKTALEIGYRHIDTAQIYNNERAVGDGISRSSVDRQEIFLATKVWFEHVEPDGVRTSTLESLDRLGVDYVDLLYVHWPAGGFSPETTLPAFVELQQQERIRFIGVSNFPASLVERSTEVLSGPPDAHQVELHPFLQQETLRRQAIECNMALVGYSPFRHGTVFDEPVIAEIASQAGLSPAQVVLAWLNQLENVFPIPKATGEAHLRDNFEAIDVELSEKHVDKIKALDQNDRYIDPPFAPDWD